MSDYSIRKLDVDDWPIFKQIRLEALSTDPFVFGSNYVAEAEHSDDVWRDGLNSQDGAIFVLFEGDAPIGMTGIGVKHDGPTGTTALLWGSWLAPKVRSRGLSKVFYEARIGWARQHPTINRVIVTHRASNLASKFANQKFGFVRTHVTEKVWNDGTKEDEVHYELIL